MKEYLRIQLKKLLFILFYLFRLFPIDNKKIMFLNFNGKGYGDSCKYIAEYLNNNSLNLDIYWTVNKYYYDFPKNIKQIKYLSLKWFYHMATSNVWVSNSRLGVFVRKRKKQLYIQTWHGGLALKKIEYDSNYLPLKYVSNMKNDTKMTNYMISNSTFCTEMYRRAFKYDGNILECGTPRNDDLIARRDLLLKKALFNKPVLKDKFIVLYVPTFRENYLNNPYDIDFLGVIKEIEKKYKKETLVLVKLHPNALSMKKLINYSDKILDFSDYSDVQELIAVSNWIITDYSSTMFEGMMANKIVLIYAKDLNKYNSERGMYFDFDEMPFDIAHNNDQLINIIKNADFTDSYKKYELFKNKVGLKESGSATEQVSNLIIDYIRGEIDNE